MNKLLIVALVNSKLLVEIFEAYKLDVVRPPTNKFDAVTLTVLIFVFTIFDRVELVDNKLPVDINCDTMLPEVKPLI